MTDPFVDQLAALCRAQVTRAKWVFVPSHSVGRTIGERIALAGTNWLNLRFVTPLDVALRMGAPYLVERGIVPSEEGLGPALVMRLLLDLDNDGGYFRPLADQPTMAQALYATLRELRMAGVKSSDLRPDAFESPAKASELRALLASYERYLSDTKRGDMAMVYQEAMHHPDWCPIQPDDCWTELPNVVWTPLQRNLLDAMPGERIAPRALALPNVAIPRRLTGARVERQRPASDSSPLAFLMCPGAERRDPSADPRVSSAEPPSGLRRASRVPASAKATAGKPSAETRVPSPGCVSLFHAGGREAEIEEVFRRILASGAALDQIEIACASEEHVALVWEKALRHDWPVTLGPGIAATATRPARALLGFCDWIETDFSASHLRRLLESGDLGLEEDEEGFTPGQAARIITKAEAGWGRDTYRLSLTALRKSYEARASDAELSSEEREYASAKATEAGRVLAWVQRLIASVPQPGEEDRVPVQPVVDAALGYLERSTARHSALDHRAADALAEYISELRALGAFSCPLPHALRFIRERVQSLQVAPERPRPGHLFASRVTQPSHSGRRILFIVGLEEGRVFPTGTEDPVLLDAERAAISPALQLSSDKIDEAVYSVLARLSVCGADVSTFTRNRATDLTSPEPRAPSPEHRTADSQPREPNAERRTASPEPRAPSSDTSRQSDAGSVTFSYSCRDTREFRDTYASWLMLQAYRLQQGNAALTYQEMKAALGEPVSCVPRPRESALSLGRWWLRSIAGTGPEGAKAVSGSFPAVARGREAVAARQSGEFTEFDGFVPEAGALLDPCRPDNAYAVTDLEAAAGCPFRFFLKRGLGVRPVDGRERDKDVWLDALTRGSELHAIYASLWRRCRDANRRPDAKKDGAWLKKLAEQRLAELQREMPAATAEILQRESEELLSDVELFLEGECADGSATPIAFEVSFGRPLGENEEELACPEPVEISLGGKLTFRIAGRIDRIDQVGPATFEVLDYKTGGCYRKAYSGTFRGGRLLQHALYGLATVEILKARHKHPKIAGGSYYFSSRKGGQERIRKAAPSNGSVAGVLSDLRDVIASGLFLHAPDDGDCTFCDFGAACGADVQDHAQAKLESDARLNVYVRLAGHE